MIIKAFFAAVIISFSINSVAAINNALCAPNDAGGNIILTKAKSKSGESIVVSIARSGIAAYGTWALIGEYTIMVIWESGRSSLFDVSMFKPCKL